MRQWCYAEQGKRHGPIPEAQLVEMLRSGQLPADTLVWTNGLDTWAAACDVENLMPVAAPLAPFPVATHPLPAHSNTGQSRPMFFHIPIGRLIFMSIISLNLYSAYWIYKNWKYVNERDGLKLEPFWRGIFGIFFVYGILKMIRKDTHANALEPATFSAGGLAAGWIILAILGRFFPIGNALLSWLFVVPAQNYINRINAKLNPQPNYAPWSAGHIVCLVLGIIFWPVILAHR